MLYVFIVSSGSMLKFDMNLAVKKVTELKVEIGRTFQIPVEEQVLLCSGGEELQEENMVGNYYGAGTDTNPIFLFRKFTNDCEYSYNVPLHTSIDLSIEDDVQGCANMAPSSSTVTVRAALAQRFADAAVKGRRECDELVHAQHLQQQGWAAVIANLEDGKDTLLKRKNHCEEHFVKYLSKRSHYEDVIKKFPEDIDILAKIPLSPKLMLGSEYFNEDLETDRTLLSWVCTEPRSFLDALVEKCQRSLEELNEHCLSALNEDVSNVLKSADNPDVKEVKGIEERLSRLNKQIEDAKRLEKDQRDLASWFVHTQSRLSRDPAVIPDLCATFQKQLLLMLANHKCLRDILERCTRAKLELSESISFRIKYISRVESDMYGLQLRIKFLEKYVQSVSMQIESFEQVHSAPKRYIQLLAETCRRKIFSSNYLKWSSELSAQTSKLYEKEISIRRSFDEEDSRNIVDNLFPGMEDVPPPFAIECPSPFDRNLPNIEREDLDVLRIQFPEFSDFCEVPPPNPMPCLYSQQQTETDDSAFSSNVPSSSRLAGDSAADSDTTKRRPDSAARSPLEKEHRTTTPSPHRLTAPGGDYGSDDYASLPNEVFSLTSSPFEDPLFPNNPLMDSTSKQHPITKHPECSDGEDFEAVEDPSMDGGRLQAGRKRSASAPRANSSSSEGMVGLGDHRVAAQADDLCPKLSKARSDGDAISPIQERLKSSESGLLVSTGDFQSTEYYIDDSMPSSYTESNATSPLPRGNRRVKSHHVVVAELQKQVDERTGALTGTLSSLKNSPHAMKLPDAKLSALQKWIREAQGALRSDLVQLGSYVRAEFGEKRTEMAQVVEKVGGTLVELQKRTEAEKEEALSIAKSELERIEADCLKRLEVEHQKLRDAESQISNYEEYIQQILANLEEAKLEKEVLESEVSSKRDIIKSMMLEHELELDSVRNQMRQELQARDDEILDALKNLKDKEFELQSLEQQKDLLDEDLEKQLKEKEGICVSLEHKEAESAERWSEMQQLQKELIRLRDAKDTSEEKLQSVRDELEATKKSLSDKVKELESGKTKELRELEEKLLNEHRSEMESLHSRYKMAVSTPAITEKSTAGDNLDKEGTSDASESEMAEQQKKIDEAVSDAVNKERVKHHKEKMQIVANMRRDREESLEKSKARLVAELQVSFNEAINSVTKEKDTVIEGLRSKVAELESSLVSIKSELERRICVQSSEALLSQSDSVASSACKVLHRDQDDKLLHMLKTQIEPQLNEHHPVPGPSSSCGPPSDESDLLSKVKLASLSKIGPCIDCTYKISILTCDVGDLILLCYEDKYDSFVSFHLGQFIHFLHSDSLQPLGLKIPAGPTERWALGVITNKEFCVARKPSNRYKMNVGTKFYRLKVKPWDREKAMDSFHLHRNSQSTTQQPTPPSGQPQESPMSASSI